MNSLRDVRPEDKQMLLEWRNLPEVAKYMYTDHVITQEEHDRWFETAMKDPSRRYWIIVCDGKDVGLTNICDLDWHNKRCNWGFYIADPNVRGKGIGIFVEYTIIQYVFGELKLSKLCGDLLSFNEAIISMHEKFGFKREGVLRQHVIKNGVSYDVVCIGLLRDEWEALKPGIENRLRQKGIL